MVSAEIKGMDSGCLLFPHRETHNLCPIGHMLVPLRMATHMSYTEALSSRPVYAGDRRLDVGLWQSTWPFPFTKMEAKITLVGGSLVMTAEVAECLPCVLHIYCPIKTLQCWSSKLHTLLGEETEAWLS